MAHKYAELFKSNKGGLKLFYDGYTFERNKVNNNRFDWVCELRRDNIYKCKVAMVSTPSEVNDKVHDIEKDPGEHNHEPNPMRKEISEFTQRLKEDAKKTGLKVCQILHNQQSSCSDEVLDNLPSKSALKQVIYRAKAKLPKIKEPNDIRFDIDVENTKIKNENFVIKDQIYDGDHRIVLLSTGYMMKMLQDADLWLLDGTFKIVPSIFQQLYTIHGNISITNNKSKTFPLLFALCTHKNKRSYDLLFELLNEYGTENDLFCNPKICILDFEKAAIQSLRSNYEHAQLHGCHFHLGQIIYRQVQAHGLTNRYARDINFKTDVKCLLALSFLPDKEIPVYFHKLLEKLQGNAKDIATWFDENYVSGTCSRPAYYQPEYWSCDVVNQLGFPRTQNSAEAWHHHINQVIDKKKTGFYLLVSELAKETIINTSDIDKMICGASPDKKRRKYVSKEEKIQILLKKKKELSEVKFLKEITKII